MTPSTLALHGLALALLVALPAALVRLLWKHRRWRTGPAVLGALTFLVFARVLEPLALLATGLELSPGAAPLAKAGAVLAAALFAAVFEETGRRLSLGWLARRDANAGGVLLSFALGYASAELLLVGVLAHAQLLVLAASPGTLAEVVQPLPPQVAAWLQRAVASLDALSALWLLVERSAAFVFQVGLTLLVWRAAQGRRLAPLLAALALHFALDLPAAAYQAGVLPLAPIELAYALAALQVWRRVRAPLQAALRDGAAAETLSPDGKEELPTRPV